MKKTPHCNLADLKQKKIEPNWGKREGEIFMPFTAGQVSHP